MDVCHEIRDNMTQEEYNAWWEAAPEDTFFSAACDKLLDMKLNSGADLIDIRNWSDIFLSPEYRDGTEPPPIISGGEILYPHPQPSNLSDDEIPF